jgi:hypothetical protein
MSFGETGFDLFLTIPQPPHGFVARISQGSRREAPPKGIACKAREGFQGERYADIPRIREFERNAAGMPLGKPQQRGLEKCGLEILRYLARLEHSVPAWESDAKAAHILAGAVENMAA